MQPQKHPWWQNAVIYQLYPQSFLDTDGDGYGDFKGILKKAPYLKKLGVDAVWINPVYQSPMVDAGYDISDFREVAGRYGTFKDYKKLIDSLHRAGIKVMMDLILAYTSTDHEYFKISSDPAHPEHAKYKDYYVWHAPKPDGGRPNNWESFFGGPAWTFGEKRGEYYYHKFYKEMALLNWRKPEVREFQYDNVRFWIKTGIDGFRMDAITCLFVDDQFRVNPGPGEEAVNVSYDYSLPQCHDVIREVRAIIDEHPGTVLLGETDCNDINVLVNYFGGKNDEIHLPMNFMVAMINKLSAPAFRQKILEWDQNKAGGWPTYFFSNHDKGRLLRRYGNGTDNDAIARLLSMLLLTLRGTSLVYYGDEIGMNDFYPPTLERIVDPRGRRYWPEKRGRDGCRTPMQWDDGPNAGFTTGKPWLPMPPEIGKINVQAQDRDPNSLLNWYRKLIKIRKSHPALKKGVLVPVLENDENILAFLRKSGAKTCLIALNMSANPVEIKAAQLGNKIKNVKKILSGYNASAEQKKVIKLGVYGSLLAEV